MSAPWICRAAYDRKAKLSSDNELLKIALAEAQGIQHGRLAALKGLILHLDAGEAVSYTHLTLPTTMPV